MGNPANEKNEKDGPSAPPVEEMPDEVPEEDDLNSSTITLNPGRGFSITCNLKPFNENLTVDEIKKILVEYTKDTWFKSSSAAQHIEILNVEYGWAHVYHLQCYNQMRQIKEKYGRYRGGRLDDESLGKIPGMWDITPVYKPKDFQKFKEKYVMPHSETVRTCSRCGGRGWNWETTTTTDSDGNTKTETEKVRCGRCGGNGVLLHWLQLNIEWISMLYGYVSVSDSNISKKRLRSAPGYYIFANKDTKVFPLEYLGSSPLCQEITNFSANAIATHEKTLLINQISIRQRQTIKVVPIAECHYRYKNKPVKTFYIFGKDRKGIYAPSFPSNVACSLM